MKHQKATGGSSNYDKEAHDRLLAKAHAFTAEVAARYPAALKCTSASGARGGSISPRWQRNGVAATDSSCTAPSPSGA